VSGEAGARRPSSPRAKLLVLVSATLLALVAAELVVRCLSPLQLGFEYEDGFFRRPSEFTRDRRTNSLGFHDREHGPPAAGTTRVILAGDSYVASLSVPVEQTVGSRLEHHLNAAGDGAWEVIALGREGWGQREELEALESKGADLRPAVVVTLFLPFNDVRNNSPELEAAGTQQAARSPRNRPGWTKIRAADAPGLVLRWSALNRLISYGLATRRARALDPEIPVDYLVYASEVAPEWQRAWESTESLLLETRSAAARLGADYLIAVASTPHGVLGAEEGLEFLLWSYPAMRGRSWDLDLPARELARICSANGIPFLALEPAFREATRAGRRLHWRYNGHWNAEGNDLAAQLIARMILERESAR
jgi:hypothetical protein